MSGGVSSVTTMGGAMAILQHHTNKLAVFNQVNKGLAVKSYMLVSPFCRLIDFLVHLYFSKTNVFCMHIPETFE